MRVLRSPLWHPGCGLRRRGRTLTPVGSADSALSHPGEGFRVAFPVANYGHGARRFARALRASPTSAEDALWQQLRSRRLGGSKWRRQVPLGPYTVDFLCVAAKLIVELDGTGHGAQRDYDQTRTREIEAQGFAVLRFGNDRVRDRLDDVLARIQEALKR